MSGGAKVWARGLTRRLSAGGRELCVLDAVDLEIGAGSFTAILGPSGSGKSTLLGLLAGLDRASEGTLGIGETELGGLDEDGLAELRRKEVGFVFQSFQLLGNLTARENVVLPLELTGHRGAGARADELLERVGLAERGHHYPSQLSGGEQQRVALARAFAPGPSVLFADEPTGNLDSKSGEKAMRLIEELRAQEGTTLILVTHDAAVAARAERRVHLEDGRIVRDERSPPAPASAGAEAPSEAAP